MASWKDYFTGLSCAAPLFTQPTLIFIFCSRVTMLTQAQSVNLGNPQILFHRADAQQTFCIRCLCSSLSPLRSVHFSLFSLNHVQFFLSSFHPFVKKILNSNPVSQNDCSSSVLDVPSLKTSHPASNYGVIFLTSKPFNKVYVQELKDICHMPWKAEKKVSLNHGSLRFLRSPVSHYPDGFGHREKGSMAQTQGCQHFI